MVDTKNVPEERIRTTFEGFTELLKVQESLLNIDLSAQYEAHGADHTQESVAMQTFSTMLDEYQEQSYLLDPYLEQLVSPVVEKVKEYAKFCVANPNKQGNIWRADRTAMILYSYVKLRGYKTIIRFFPHEIADLSIALEFMQIPDGIIQSHHHWSIRYVTLLWLYIICIIPFDLAQFDEADRQGQTADTLQTVAKTYLGTSGLEREAAALLLSRLYIRKDTGSGFHDFVKSTEAFLQEDSADRFRALGFLQVLCEVVKSGSAEQIHNELPTLLSIGHIIQTSPTYSSNTILRKLRTKLVSRVGLRLLPTVNIRHQGRRLVDEGPVEINDEEQEIVVPEEIEDILGQTLEALEDRDTIVRWSAAKGISRIAQRLPKDFSGQVLETVLGLFEIHSVAAATLYDLPATAEATWHGACLACAELARRSLIGPEHLPQLVDWLSKALYFDLRKGAHSIGSNVRDAASYVLWALARTQDESSLVSHASNLAQRLTAVALYDREIHIRRAASAAFQEHVGRTNLFPHGIDVLGKTDFYAVSIRKHAFLVAAPQVAEHAEYRDFLVDHILDVILRHWDISMRELGAQSLRLICSHDLDRLGPRVVEKSARLLESLDTSDMHGGLSALSEIAIAYKERTNDPMVLEDRLRNIFKYMKLLPENTLNSSRNELIVTAACRLTVNSITVTEVNLGSGSSVPGWREIVEVGLKHWVESVQDTAAAAMAIITDITESSSDITRLIAELKRGSPVMHQSLAKLLSVINYNKHPTTLPDAIAYLLESVKPGSKATIETRRSCYQAIPSILSKIAPQLASCVSGEVLNTLTDALLAGLDDYTIDERGDVGSWVRITCIQGLTTISELLFGVAHSIPDFQSYFSPQKYRTIAAGILKQGVERLDNVRQTAGLCFNNLLNAVLPLIDGGDRWRLPAVALLKELFQDPSDQAGWKEGTWLFPRAMRLLEVSEYREKVLSGIVISIGSKTDSTQRPVSRSLVNFAQNLPLVGGQTTSLPPTYTLVELVNDLIKHAKSNMTRNAVVVPVFQTFTILFEADVLRHVPDEPSGLESLKTLLSLASNKVERLKSVQRIHEAMKIVVNLFTFEQIRNENESLLIAFLAHAFPKVRSDTAEYLYLLLQSADLGIETDGIDDILLETEWLTSTKEEATKAGNGIVELFKSKNRES